MYALRVDAQCRGLEPRERIKVHLQVECNDARRHVASRGMLTCISMLTAKKDARVKVQQQVDCKDVAGHVEPRGML